MTVDICAPIKIHRRMKATKISGHRTHAQNKVCQEKICDNIRPQSTPGEEDDHNYCKQTLGPEFGTITLLVVTEIERRTVGVNIFSLNIKDEVAVRKWVKMKLETFLTKRKRG